MSNIILALVVFAPLLIATAFFHYEKNLYKKKWQHPLWEGKSIRRPPGAYLGQKLITQTLDALSNVFQLYLSSVIVALLIYAGAVPSGILMGILILIWGAWFIYSMRKLAKQLENNRKDRLGYECELVVGQELNLLMLDGWQVFHDVVLEGKKFNIDHIVVGTGGVFAVETKGKSKPRLNGQKQYKVTYKDNVLHSPPKRPDYWSTKQARKQSKCVQEWLSQVTGQKVPVHPVLVLPGWNINQEGSKTLSVLSLGEIRGHFRKQQNQLLSAEQVREVVKQIEQGVIGLTPRELTDFTNAK